VSIRVGKDPLGLLDEAVPTSQRRLCITDCCRKPRLSAADIDDVAAQPHAARKQMEIWLASLLADASWLSRVGIVILQSFEVARTQWHQLGDVSCRLLPDQVVVHPRIDPFIRPEEHEILRSHDGVL
jgi:hypothetical protein